MSVDSEFGDVIVHTQSWVRETCGRFQDFYSHPLLEKPDQTPLKDEHASPVIQ